LLPKRYRIVHFHDTAQYRCVQGEKSMTSGLAKRTLARVDDKRNVILGGAKEVFLREGFGGTSMDAVAEAAGVSKMTVYRHFTSKELLFAGLISELCEKIVDDDVETMLQRPPKEALYAFAKKMIAIVFAPDTIELHRIVLAESRRFPKLGELFYEAGPERCISALTAYFERYRRDPKLKIGEPRQTAEEFLDLLRGYPHLRISLGVQSRLTSKETEARIRSAIGHVVR
jgi:TetR/AcrR family transcriptional regulator, mexJK operon transcriptional repressor